MKSEPGSRPDRDVDILGFLLVDAARLLRAAFERRIAQAALGLTPGEARALLNIAALDGSRQLDIAARMGVEPMTLCGHLDKLQAIGLIDRQQCDADRRAKRIRLTPASAELLTAIRREFQEIIACATEGMDEEMAHQLCGALTTFNSNLQAFDAPPALQA